MGIETCLFYACCSPVILCMVCFRLLGDLLLGLNKPSHWEEETADVRPEPQVNIGNDIVSDGYTPYEDAKACYICERINIDYILSPNGYAHHKSYQELEL